jgi:hypothetical protein
MNPLLGQAEEFIGLGIKAEKRGLYTFAAIRYSQAWTTLVNLVTLRDSGTIPLSSSEEAKLAALYHILRMRLEGVVKKMTNGHGLSGKASNDSPREAFLVILEEMETFM